MPQDPIDDPRPDPDGIAALLKRWNAEDEALDAALFDQVYPELRNIARAHLGRERSGHTLDPTALVHEAWLRLEQHDDALRAPSREELLAYCSRVMRTLLVDHARRRNSLKRGGGRARISLHGDLDAAPAGEVDVVELDDGLKRLSELDPVLGRISELRLFGGLPPREVAAALGMSLRTVERRWRVASTWLRRELAGLEEGAEPEA